jgi:hypothetical protein
MSARDAIVHALQFYTRNEQMSGVCADAVLVDLKAAGYAVVKLPEQTIIPTGWREDCLGAWPSGVNERPFEDPVSAWPDREGVSLPNGDFVSAERARVFAAALIAAANAAEEAAS